MSESRDESRGAQVDWTGAVLAVLGLGALVFALLEWPTAGSPRPEALASLAVGIASLAALVVVERRVTTPMLPLRLFKSRTFTLANLLTLLVYGALAIVLWLVPLKLIQVHRYSATVAGAAFLPLPLLIFFLSRWTGGLVSRVGSRLPLTIGPVIVAAGLTLLALGATGDSYWITTFPGVTVVGLGMAVVVAPLTTTVMGAVEVQHAGVASGVNNAVARIAGLVAIAALGVVLIRSFDARVGAALDRLTLAPASRAAIDRELPKLAGADIGASVAGDQRVAVRRAIDASFMAAFRLVMNVVAGIAVTAALAGFLLPPAPPSPNG